jgi:hypothetical protein
MKLKFAAVFGMGGALISLALSKCLSAADKTGRITGQWIRSLGMKTMERRWEMIKTPLSFWFLAAAIAAVMTGCDGGGGSGDISPFTVEDGVGAADFDGDGRTDIALAATYISHSPPHPAGSCPPSIWIRDFPASRLPSGT